MKKMTISKEEYKQLENEYVKEQYKLADPKPYGMCGTWSWHINMKEKFAKLMKQRENENV
jgi:hypothetical protein